MCPRWWQYYPAATITSLWNPFLPHCPLTVIPYTPHTYICTARALWQSAGYPPQWQYLHITRTLQALTHAATFVSSNMNGDDGNISSLMTHLKLSVQWPRTSTNVNDALSVSGHHLAKVGGSLLSEGSGPPFSCVLTSNIITPRDQRRWSHERWCDHNYGGYYRDDGLGQCS